jgi:2-iminobutanoate/2-iminopropanoate deaminase
MPQENMIVNTMNAPQAIGAYGQGVIFGNTVYFSGILGLNPEVMKLESNFDSQLSRIMKNMDALIESQNLKRENIIKTTIFLKDLSEFPKVNKAYEEYFTKPYPARTCIEVKGLPLNAEIEIEVIAGI